MKFTLRALSVAIAVMLLPIAGGCSNTNEGLSTAPQTLNRTATSAAANNTVEQAQPARTPTPVPKTGLGVTRNSVQSGLEDAGFSFVSYASTGSVFGDSPDGVATVKLFAPDNNLRDATLQFSYSPTLDVANVVLHSMIFINLVLPDWNNSGEWLADAFSRVGDGDTAETTIETNNGKAYIVLEIIGDDTISLDISSSNNEYALEILGVSSTPTPGGSTSQSAAKSGEGQPTQPAPVVSQRWNDKRNTLCSSLGLDANLCETIALNQTAPDGETQDLELPDEPDSTPVPIDDVGGAVDELQEIVASEGEVSIQVLTYTENLISQAAEAVVQAEKELANQEATAAYLDAKKQELQELRQTYAQLLVRIGLAQDRSLALAEQVEQEHLASSIERANGEALIRYKDARLAHTNALAAAEKNAIAQIEGIAAANTLASSLEPETTDLAPLYAARDKAQSRYNEAAKEFEKQVQEYERNWLTAYEYYIADRDGKPDPPIWRGIRYENYTIPRRVVQRRDMQELKSGITSIREQGKSRKDVNLTLLQKELTDAERAIVRAIAGNEKAQKEVSAYNEEASVTGIAVTNARLAVVEAYNEHGISEGHAGAIFRFTDSGEDAVTYNLSLVALNQQADASLSDFKAALAGIVDTLHTDIQAAGMARDIALSVAEDTRFTSADTDARARQARDEWEEVDNLRNRIIMFDVILMLVGWDYYAGPRPDLDGAPGFDCRFDQEGYRTAANVGRDDYIRGYWHKEQPLRRTYTKDRLMAVKGVLDDLEDWLQGRIDYWALQGRDGERLLQQCEIALHGNPERDGWQGVREWRQAIIAETAPILGE